MKKKQFNFLKLHIILAALVAITTISLLTVHLSNQREQQAYREAGGEIVVLFRDKMSEQGLSYLVEQYDREVKIVSHIEDYALLEVKDSSHFNNILHKLKADEAVLEAQENTIITTLGFSNDTYAEAQWAIENPGHYINMTQAGRLNKLSIPDMDMDVVEAWKKLSEDMLPKREVIVAVIDTGVDYTHPDLVDHMWTNKGEIPGDNLDNDENGYVDDYYGWDFYNGDNTVCHYSYSDQLKQNISLPEDNDDHGTHVAGIIGATIDNGIGVAGVASRVDVKIMTLKINGGPKGTGTLSNAVEAIKYATSMGADICNLSWGTSSYTASLKRVMKESDMLFIAAAGNTGDDNNFQPIYPASLKLDNMISVTFIDSDGELTELSNFGLDSVDIAAPGENIMSTIVGSYGSMSGSSMAAPQVSAIAALLYACNDHVYPSNVKELILTNRKEIPELQEYIRFAGIPSAYQSLIAAGSLSKDYDTPTISFSTIYKSSEIIVPVKVTDIGKSEVRVVRWGLGEKSIKDFARGVKGTALEDSQITVSKAGKYSFYASDYAGNEIVQVYEVLDDKKGPSLNTSYTVADNYQSRTVTVRYSDIQSGVKRMEYMAGTKKAEDFLPGEAGIVLDHKDGKVKFDVKKDGTYTIFGIDNRGNMSVKIVTIRTVKSQMLQLSQSDRTMNINDAYTLRAYITPSSSTDRVTFSSSDETVATVSSTGKITALSEGTATIFVNTSNGLKSNCKITVIQNSSG
jgi:uncharacterized protein YjdB